MIWMENSTGFWKQILWNLVWNVDALNSSLAKVDRRARPIFVVALRDEKQALLNFKYNNVEFA